MARAAVAQAAGGLEQGQTVIRLKNVIWARPSVVGDQPVQVHIGLYPEDNGEIVYEIYSGAEGCGSERIMHSQGSAILMSEAETPSLDIAALQAQCALSSLDSCQCYELFKEIGLEYGPAHQGTEQVYVGWGQVLAKLTLPSIVSCTRDHYVNVWMPPQAATVDVEL
jgi:polyketide synthase PksN